MIKTTEKVHLATKKCENTCQICTYPCYIWKLCNFFTWDPADLVVHMGENAPKLPCIMQSENLCIIWLAPHPFQPRIMHYETINCSRRPKAAQDHSRCANYSVSFET